MNSVAEEMLELQELMHYGMPRRSGRYPWGSGEDPYQRTGDFISRIEELKKTGWTETPENIKKEFGLTTTEYRIEKKIAKDERRAYDVARAKSLKADGLGYTEIGKKMGINESTVRSLLNEKSEARMNKASNTANLLAERLKEVSKDGGMIDVGAGAELELNVSKETLNTALYLLKREGYEVYSGGIAQPTNVGQQTTQKVLCMPGTKHSEIYDLDRVHAIKDYITRDDAVTFEKKFNYPSSMDSKRLQIRYAEDVGPDGFSGISKDGVIELRRDCADLSLGNNRYSQVRILVDGTHYLKGMAVYSDNMPDGVDVIFNTNKTKGTPMNKVLKEIKNDPDNPFGSAIKDADQGGQYWYDPKTGKQVSASTPGAKLGLINKRAAEGDWTDWKDALPSQFLAKQSEQMINKQLSIAKADKLAEFQEICELNNPTIKKHYLDEFASKCDSAAVHLQAAALPNQKYHVILPINSLKDTEVYAPRYENGTQLALVRYPHGGTFEIPILTVNNKNKLAKQLLGPDATDAVGITSKVAERLSGADFDGDTVMCIPTHDKAGKVKVTSTPALKGLEGFDPKEKYSSTVKIDDDGTTHYYNAATGKEFKPMKNTNIQMGVISNLITDMTLAGANENELAAAVRHSMVVIDAEKHKLDYKQSAIDNNIASLHTKYQGKAQGGAATILSRAKGEYDVDKRQGSPSINIKGKKDYDPTRPEGALIYKTADPKNLYKPAYTADKKTGTRTYKTVDGKKITFDPSDDDARAKYAPVKKVDPDTGDVTYTSRDGKYTYTMEKQTQKSTRMAETDDAYTLISDFKHPKERAYADFANSMKALANQARKEKVSTGNLKYDASANKVYKEEVDSLNLKLKNAELNRTRERAALRKANVEIDAKKKAYKEETGSDMKTSDVKKISQQAVSKARTEVGAVKRSDRSIKITDREWEAIQAGAVSESILTRILNNADADTLRERATPRTSTTLSTAKINRIKAMSSSYTLQQIADKLGVPVSTVAKYAKG